MCTKTGTLSPKISTDKIKRSAAQVKGNLYISFYFQAGGTILPNREYGAMIHHRGPVALLFAGNSHSKALKVPTLSAHPCDPVTLEQGAIAPNLYE
jgi:hypothetical protein